MKTRTRKNPSTAHRLPRGPHNGVELLLIHNVEDLGKQEHAARFGMWIFLGSELLLFAGLFALYAAYRAEYARAFTAGVHHNALYLGTTNTVVLIVSSFTVAWAVHSMRAARPRVALRMLVLTMLLGATFLVIKGFEYAQHFAEGIFPGRYYAFDGLPEGGKLFFTLYYLMTGLHGLHVVGGMAALTVATVRAAQGTYGPAHYTPLELVVLYWHLVDVIWIFLWPLLYLVG